MDTDLINKAKQVLIVPMLVSVLGISGTTGATAQSETMVTVRISTSIDTLDGLLPKIGQDLGIMREHGLELDFRAWPGGATMLADVLEYKADVTHVSAGLVFSAISRGAPLIVLSSNYDIDYSIVASSNIPLPHFYSPYPENIRDFEGKRIGVVARGGATERLVSKVLSDAGLDPISSVEYVSVGTGVGAAGAIMNNQVDFLVVIPPSDQLIDSDAAIPLVDNKSVKSDVYGTDFLFSVFSANAAFVEQSPQTAEAFCSALTETYAFVVDEENRSVVLSYLENDMNLPPALAERMWDEFGMNFNIKLEHDRWEKMRDQVAVLPDWDTATFEPCIRATDIDIAVPTRKASAHGNL
ncbi:ABC transporter substrate-binding protein [Leisingera thetidis]|uniref:ABC transporter substrate-binding protein n=1 Tax=Leisingera thetidis TaxID=2930199 RepID=UPI0021F7F162|nr:ABC transporter substrate-binding protein [Leisingera thetidis]